MWGAPCGFQIVGLNAHKASKEQNLTISMYKASAPVFVQFLTSLSVVLDKGAAFIAARKLDEAEVLRLRVYPDMFPLVRQVQVTADRAVNCIAKLAGIEPPQFDNNEASFAALRTRIEKAIAFVKSVKPEQIDGTEEKEVIFKTPRIELKFTGQQWLLNFSLPNFYFHHTAAYILLRQLGVEVGKLDYLGNMR
jgi:hypothetical protein